MLALEHAVAQQPVHGARPCTAGDVAAGGCGDTATYPAPRTRQDSLTSEVGQYPCDRNDIIRVVVDEGGR